jgi:hypothetical protein
LYAIASVLLILWLLSLLSSALFGGLVHLLLVSALLLLLFKLISERPRQ